LAVGDRFLGTASATIKTASFWSPEGGSRDQQHRRAPPISRSFSAVLRAQVSKSDFGGTGVSDCVVVSTTPRLSKPRATAEHAYALTPMHRRARSTRLPSQGWNRKGCAIALREPQRGSLIPPVEGQTGVGHQLVGGEAGRCRPRDLADAIAFALRYRSGRRVPCGSRKGSVRLDAKPTTSCN